MAKSLTKKETFSFAEPGARHVELVGDFTAWEQHPIELKKQKDGSWKATVALEPGAHEYRYVVDGQWRDDPQCQSRRANPFGQLNCVREVG